MTPNRDPDRSATGAFYRRLEVGPGASHDEIVRAYRRLALGVHPDAHPEDPHAAGRFRDLTEAYEVLGDPVRREAYDGGYPSTRRISVRRRQAGGAPAGGRTEGEVEISPPSTVLGASKPRLMGEVPLRVGPVHIGPPSGAEARTASSAALFLEILGSWWRR
jgi:curved DNA-binding protein CbpA